MRAKFGFMVLSLLTFATLMIIVLYLLPQGTLVSTSAAPDLLPSSEAPLIFAEKVTLSEAQARVLYTIPLPDVLASASIQEVWASTNSVAPAQRSVAVIFSDGIKVIVHPAEDQSPDWDAIIADSPEFTRITIRGHPGMGTDPGVQEIRGRQYSYPGSVSWWVNGLLITIYSDTLSLGDLLKVAESVPNIPTWK